MIKHSESYIKRLSYPKGSVKPYEEHVQHFIKRIKERFDIDLTEIGYHDLLSKINQYKSLYAINSGTSLFETTIDGKLVWLLYGNKSDRIDGRFKTVLIPYKQYPVPECIDATYDQISFTEKINEVINEMKHLSTTFTLDHCEEFFSRSINNKLKAAAKKYKVYGESIMSDLVSMAARYIVEITPKGSIRKEYEGTIPSENKFKK